MFFNAFHILSFHFCAILGHGLARNPLVTLCVSDRSACGTVLSLIYRSRNPLVTLCMLDRSRRDAHFDIACATLPSLCACCIVSLWCGAHFDIFLATLPSLCACWIALVVGRFALFYTGAATQSLLHTESLYTQDFFARPRFYTKMFTHRSFYTQKL